MFSQFVKQHRDNCQQFCQMRMSRADSLIAVVFPAKNMSLDPVRNANENVTRKKLTKLTSVQYVAPGPDEKDANMYSYLRRTVAN